MDFKNHEGLLNRLLNMRSAKRELHALSDISLQANAGEVIGLIGKNGSGKSTLLKIMAGVYLPDKGLVRTNGSLVYLTGLGQGMIPKLTMRENIFLMGTIMGLSQKEVKGRFEEIVALSGLGEFVDAKVHQFSSGMVGRLNFSIMLHSVKQQQPEIILLDEVFGGPGDIDFKKTAIEKMEELLKSGATVVIASHELETIKKYCNRVMVLEKGNNLFLGDPAKAVELYLNGKQT